MSIVFMVLTLIALSVALVGFVLQAKNLRIGQSLQAWEDDEQMRLVNTTTRGSGADVVTTLH